MFTSNFTRIPHLAGTEQNFQLAKQIQSQWKEFGLDSVELAHYDVLLSYPNKTHPNYISIIDEDGNEVKKIRKETPLSILFKYFLWKNALYISNYWWKSILLKLMNGAFNISLPISTFLCLEFNAMLERLWEINVW